VEELAWVLEREIELAPPRSGPACFRSWRSFAKLDDRTLRSALRRALEYDADAARARSRKVARIRRGAWRRPTLEPLSQGRAGDGALRVLEVEELAQDDAPLRDAKRRSNRGSGRRPERALELASRRGDAGRNDPSAIPRWLSGSRAGVRRGKPAELAAVLLEALGDLPVASPEMLQLARAAGEALVRSGDSVRAIEVFRRALTFEPSSPELLQRIDELLAEQGNPQERLALYASALASPGDPARRRELLHRLAQLQRRELADLDAAIHSWRLALEEDPRDWIAHQALVEAYTERKDWRTLYAELERAIARRRNAASRR
jgi:tetratricopeptide (TPR) repeat protein